MSNPEQIAGKPSRPIDGWRFWIDVGGTFTDCLAVGPDGAEFQAKVLSSGLTKGRLGIQVGLPWRIWIGPGCGEEFWAGAKFRMLDATGMEIHESLVAAYDCLSGEIVLEQWPAESWERVLHAIESANATRFELDHSIAAPILAIRKILQLAPSNLLPDCAVHLGTTRGTNALLTRTGAKTAFVTTHGFRDLLTIGDQSRPHLFALAIQKPKSLCSVSIEIEERILADGTVDKELESESVRRQLAQLKAEGIESIAICLMHGFRFPEHEEKVAAIAGEFGFTDIRRSSEVAPLIKILARGETTVLDAYLNPVLSDYLDQIRAELSPKSELRLMTSAGGLVHRDLFSGKDSILSGPAGGIVGASRVAEQAGFDRVLSFDMGGTSTDVGRYDQRIELEYETRKSDVRIMMPMVAIETVAAGGGSICRFDGTRLVVGPESASSDPGPACYGRGGPLAVTDVNLFLGRMVKEKFPFPLEDSAVEIRLQEICNEMEQAGFKTTLPDLARGFLAIANQNMAAAIRSVSAARGYDPENYLLVAFGGAGPQHCCAVADAIGVKTILDPPQGSILSAVGIRLADRTLRLARSVLGEFGRETMDSVVQDWQEMEATVVDRLGGQTIEITRSLDLRYQGTEACQTVDESEFGFEVEFSRVHQRLFGFTSQRPLEIVACRVEGRRPGQRLERTKDLGPVTCRASMQSQTMWVDTAGKSVACSVPVFERADLNPGDRIPGPAIVTSEMSTTIVDQNWEASVLADHQLLLARTETCVGEESWGVNRTALDPVRLEIFNNYFSTIASQMGISLQKTSMSVNVKERLDFSCAIFTESGDLVVNAPHIPVHLGAMSETVRSIIRQNSNVFPGDVFVTNDPFAGGSHLPDVTVVTPVFDDCNEALIFWVASRSHHAEIGGCTPGSMPPAATCLEEEGVLIRNFKLIDGKNQTEFFQDLMTLLKAPPYPSRSPDQNVADIRAQMAANQTGIRNLLELVELYSLEVVQAYTLHIQDAAERKTRAVISQMDKGRFEYEDSLDNGATIRVSLEKLDDDLVIDFTGTDPVLEGNLNANPAIVASAVIYVMRCLIQDDIPLNEGVMKPISIVLPECFLNPASFEDPNQCPAVVGGNVETSQRIVDVLLGALQQSPSLSGIAGASQGTMNNWLMGDESFGYYETMGGGAGATQESNGADAVHTHMTNTRLTDPEVLEDRYPVVLREFSIRSGSGGEGLRSGGDGMIREIEFLKPLTVSMLTNRRTTRPYGMLGGSPGKSGCNEWIQLNANGVGDREPLPGSCQIDVQPGDRIRIETPGGGGVGALKNNDRTP